MTMITVKDVTRGTIVAQGKLDEDVILLEGAYYFAPEQVQTDHLTVTNRVYVCPYKGRMLWIDLLSENGPIRDVAWVYNEPDARYEYIRDKIGFAFGMRPGIVVEKS